MTWGIEEEKPTKKEDEPITDVNELITVYNKTKHRAQNDIDQGIIVMMPIIEKLMGDEKSVKNIGLIGNLRFEIRNSPLKWASFGTKTAEALENIENLVKWQDRYTSQMTKYVDAFEFLCESGMLIIHNLMKQLDVKEAKIMSMEEQIMGKVKTPQSQEPFKKIKEPEPKSEESLTEKEELIFKKAFRERVEQYVDMINKGDNMKAIVAKSRAFSLAKYNNRKKIIAEQLFEEMTRDLQKNLSTTIKK